MARIYGGRLADRVGGSRITLWVVATMAVVTAFLVTVSTLDDQASGPTTAATMVGDVCGFMALFTLVGGADTLASYVRRPESTPAMPGSAMEPEPARL